jgi:hypothetical protein
MQSEWHRDSVSLSTDVLKIMSNKEKSIIDQLNTAQHSQIEQNTTKKLVMILSSLLFCATHDLAIRGKLICSGNFHDLLKFHVESGDKYLIHNIFISLPPTTYTIERSFNTLRRVKMWLCLTTEEDRLNGLCMMSLYHKRVNANKDIFINIF